MTDWRVHAENDDWMRIELSQLTADELVELQEIVLARVPKRTRGDGLEIFEDFIRPHQTHDRIALRAAVFRGHLLRNPILNRLRIQKLFTPAVELAKSTLQEKLGITYEGLLDTYLEELTDGTLAPVCRVDGEIGLKQVASKFDFSLEFEKEPKRSQLYVEGFRHWALGRPPRRTKSLAEHWFWEKFEANSDMDHAISILDAEFRYSFLLQYVWNVATQANENVRIVDPWIAAELGFKIGRHFAALQKKPIEKHAISRLEQLTNNRENGKRGGQGEQKRERYTVLNRLAKKHSGFVAASDKSRLRQAKQIARTHDEIGGTNLFSPKGKFLSDKWFKDWVAEFLGDFQKLQ